MKTPVSEKGKTMSRFRTVLVCCLLLMTACVLLAVAGARAADDPADKFIAEIISGAKTNSERAAKLVEAAKVVRGQPKVLVAILEKAVEFGVKWPVTPAGCKAAADALDFLEEEFPDRKDEWTPKRADVCRVKYRSAKTRSGKQAAGKEFLLVLLAAAEVHEKSGNWTEAIAIYREASLVDAQVKAGKAYDIRRKLKTARHFETMAKRVAQYEASIKKDPSKASIRDMLVELLVVELNDPQKAIEYLNEDVDKMWRTYVPLAARDIDDLAEASCFGLGQWYHKELPKNASLTCKGVLLRRAKDYYKHFVERQASVNVQTFRAKGALAEVEKELAMEEARAKLAIEKAEKERDKFRKSVTIHWNIADDADVYLNGKPLREYKPDFRSRRDEARKRFSVEAKLGFGDVFTVGGRRGDSSGFLLAAIDKNGRTVWQTDTKTWCAYVPADEKKWYLPSVAAKSKKTKVPVRPNPWYVQNKMRNDLRTKAKSIWPGSGSRMAYLLSVVR